MPFTSGTSGNLKGRPKGSGLSGKLRKAIEDDAPAIIKAMVEAAKAGDVTAGKALLDRCVPALKPKQQAEYIAGFKGERIADQGASIIESAARGDISAEQMQQLLAGLASLARIIEVDELERRLTELEKRSNDD